MKNAMTIAALALSLLAGCASQQDPAPAAGPMLAAQGAPAAQARKMEEDDTPLTGSRLAKRKSTDRLLKSVGNTEARDAMDSAPDPLKSGQ